MDYEDKYKNALKWARSIYPNAVGADKEDLEHCFPELKGSEDERIREDLIGFFKEGAFLYHKNAEIVDWLEKQGGSSRHYWTEEEIEPIISDYLRGAEHYGGMIGRLRCLKPKSSPTWSEEDEQGYEDVVWCINKAIQACNNEDETGTCWFAHKWVNSIRTKQRLGGK